LDGEHVVFGKVVQGMDIVYAIEGGAGTYSGKPRKKVVIADSGEIDKSHWDDETWTFSLLVTNTTTSCFDYGIVKLLFGFIQGLNHALQNIVQTCQLDLKENW